MPTVVRGGRRQSGSPAARGQGVKRAGPKKNTGGKPQVQQAHKLHALSIVNLSPAAVMTLAVVVLSAGGFFAFTASGVSAVHGVSASANAFLARCGLRLTGVRMRGASEAAKPAIRQALNLTEGESLIGLDLKAIQARVEQVGWVKSVRVTRLFPDTLGLDVVERKPLAVWRNNGKTLVIDDEGVGIPEADPAAYSNLPLVMGDGAGETAAQIWPMIASRPRLASRVDALVRVDQRRWDLRLKDGGIISLPATHEEAALITLDQLDQRDRILELELERVDLRSPEAISVRPRAAGNSRALAPAAHG